MVVKAAEEADSTALKAGSEAHGSQTNRLNLTMSFDLHRRNWNCCANRPTTIPKRSPIENYPKRNLKNPSWIWKCPKTNRNNPNPYATTPTSSPKTPIVNLRKIPTNSPKTRFAKLKKIPPSIHPTCSIRSWTNRWSRIGCISIRWTRILKFQIRRPKSPFGCKMNRLRSTQRSARYRTANRSEQRSIHRTENRSK